MQVKKTYEKLKKKFDDSFDDIGTIEKLKESAKISTINFYIFTIISLVIAIVGGITCIEMFNALRGLTESTILTVLILLGFMNVLNFFLLMFIWFTNESSYYQNIAMHKKILIYLKKKLGD